MSFYRNPTCPKCSSLMHGPEWDRFVDELKYRCGCGYTTTRPTDDKLTRPTFNPPAPEKSP